MASSRPNSMLIATEMFDDVNHPIHSKSSKAHKRSSSSSIDSGSTKNDPNSSSQLPSTARMSTTTSDSDLESEQDDARHSPTHLQKRDFNPQDHSSRRRKHFYKLFRSEITDGMPELIDSYVCAYQGDILLQGKMYITDRYLCFHSRIISYVTKHVYRWEEIENVSKERVAFIFPTAIGIQLKPTGKKVIYASFLTRDQAYDKIVSVWSGSTNDAASYNDDEETDIADDGTLRADNNYRRKKNRETYDVIDGPEQEDVLHMYIKQNHDKGSINSSSSKSSNDKQTTTKKPTARHSNLEHKLSNGVHENTDNHNVRSSRYTKHDPKQKTETKKRHTSLGDHRSQSHTRQTHESVSRDQTSSPRHPISSQSNTPTNTSSTVDDTSHGIGMKVFNSSVSFLNLILQTVLSIFQRIRTYSMKSTILILLFLALLFLHSFYLIKLSYRIENRLQSLHHLWPSSSSSSSRMKHSFSSNTKEL